ncbi:hypothetical protein ABID19_003195 [Mesorhizobium robiniae]|uniref:Uncharacterized protein n=1 Tax=Mesorhizobium robiniae TaxID=559315 RepID=A0ABV2GPS6_9HYPH
MTYRFNYVNGHPKNERQLTLFDSVGVKATTLYTSLDLLADPEEPRDLYGMLLRAAA